VFRLDNISSSQLSSIGTNRHAKQNVFIHDLKTRYMLCPRVKYPMCSLKSTSDSIIFIPRDVKARLYIFISQLSSIGTNRRVKQDVVIHYMKAWCMLCPRIKYHMCSLKSKTDLLLFIPRGLKAIFYLNIYHNSVQSERITRRKKTLLFTTWKRDICCAQE
jgi:hypothetical protein